LYAIAKATGKEIIFPESSVKLGWGFKFNKVLDIDVKLAPDNFFNDFIEVVPTENVLVDVNMFTLDRDANYNIAGLLYGYGYWYGDYKQDILNWNWRNTYQVQAEVLYSKIKLPGKETVAIHVRRGDYTLPQHHHFCQLDTDYYEKALQHFFEDVDRYQFVIFSNDIEWCKQNLIEHSDIVTFIEPGEDYTDLVLMSLCDHNIVANSSYSWWAAFKNRNQTKIITCPTNYVKQYSSVNFINGKYYPPTWKNIDNIK
jgi:hypothetical protein